MPNEDVEYNEMRHQAALNRNRRDDQKQRYLEDSKKRLLTIAERKVRTAFIGALAGFEGVFGFLWGFAPIETLTPEQLLLLELIQDNGLENYFKELWTKAREKVLTNGNNQIRALEDEFPQYSIEWTRYKTLLPVKGPSGVSGN